MSTPELNKIELPPLFGEVAVFAAKHCVSPNSEGYNCKISDVLQVATLWPRNPRSFRVDGRTKLGRLYNAFAQHKQDQYNFKPIKPEDFVYD